MPMPKSRITRSRRGMRRSHDGLTAPTVHTDETTGELKRPHRAVRAKDGALYYKGKQITAPKFELDESEA